MVDNEVEQAENLDSGATSVLGFKLSQAAINHQSIVIFGKEFALCFLILHQNSDSLDRFVEAIHRSADDKVKKLLFVDLLSLEELSDD